MPIPSTPAAFTLLAFLAAFTFPPANSPTSAVSGYADLHEAGMHRPAIEALEAAGILNDTECSTAPLRFCPKEPLSRRIMAVWLVRALEGGDTPPDGALLFADVDPEFWWAAHVRRLAVLGVTRGCATDPARFCPDEPVTRDQMAAFLVRAFDLSGSSGSDHPQPIRFTDTENNPHARAIGTLADASITVGCEVDPLRYCPHRTVTRGEMATFLARASGLVQTVEYTMDVDGRGWLHLVSRYTTYHDCCAPRVTNIQLFADRIDGVVVRPYERFSLNRHVGRRTSAKGYVRAGTLVNGEVVDSVGGGISQVATTLYNAVFWGGYQDVVHHPHSRYFSRYPEGIEATLDWPGTDLIFRNDSARNVIVKAEYTATSLTIKLFGDNNGRTVVGEWKDGRGSLEVLAEGGDRSRVVTADISGRTNITPPPPPLYRSDPSLEMGARRTLQPAVNGWTMRVTRTIRQGERRAVRQWVVRYAPLQAIVEAHPCVFTQSCGTPRT